VLAGQGHNPGSFSRRTVNLISDLDKRDALMFQSLCCFGWVIGTVIPLVFEVEDEIYARHDVTFNTLTHLDSLGLIQFNGLATFSRKSLPKQFVVLYYGDAVELTMPKEKDNQLTLGHVLFTQAGHELAQICNSRPIPEFFDYVQARWIEQNLVRKATNDSEPD